MLGKGTGSDLACPLLQRGWISVRNLGRSMSCKASGPRGLVLAVAFGAWIAPAAPSSAQDAQGYVDLSARVWLDRGDDPVLQSGDRVRVYYRASYDAYVAVFQITTDGVLRLMYPAAPHQNGFARGGRDYRVLLPESPYWFVDDAPGMGYFFVVASPDPMDYSSFAYSRQDGGWDLSLVGQNVYTDPYLAMDDVVAALIPDWEYVPYALDFLSYDVGGAHDYPRFLCYDCHGYRPYNAWDPYQFSCVSFRLVIWDDPFYYPAYRYSGTRVVWTRPAMPGRYPRFSFKERADGEPGSPELVRREISAGSGAPVPSDFNSAYRSGSGSGRSSLRGVPTAQPRGFTAGGARPVVSGDPRASSQRLPSGSTSSRGAVSGTRQGTPTPPASGAPVVQRRPTRTSPPTRPSARVNTTGSRGSARPPTGGVSSPRRTGTGSRSVSPGRVVSPRKTVSPSRSGNTRGTVISGRSTAPGRSVTPQRTVNPTRPPASSGRGGVSRTPSRSSPPVPTKRAPPSRPPPKKGGGGGQGGFGAY